MAEKKHKAVKNLGISITLKQDKLTTQHFKQLAQARVVYIIVIHYKPLAKTFHQLICNWQ